MGARCRWVRTDWRRRPPLNYDESRGMLIDDMECGDVNRDGVDDCVLCGNSTTSHVLTYRTGTYSIDYSGPRTRTSQGADISFTQTCSIGDIDNDGHSDWFDSSAGGGLRVFSYINGSYRMIWDYPRHGCNPPIGASAVGDADNDGWNEFLIVRWDPNPDPTQRATIEIWESDVPEATSFTRTFTWPGLFGTNMMVGNFNPYND